MKKKLLLISLCGMAGAAIGIGLNSIGVFYRPIAESLQASQGAVSTLGTLYCLSMAVVTIFVTGNLSVRNIRRLLIGGLILSVGGILLMAVSQQLIHLYIGALLFGLGASTYSSSVINMLIANNYHERIGFLTGLIFSLSGIAGALCAPFFTWIISSTSWRAAFIVMAVMVAVLLLPSLFVDFRIAEKKEQQAEGFNYFSLAFILALGVMALLQSLAGIPQHFVNFSVTRGLNESTGTLMMSACMAGNIGFKLLTGIIKDRIGTIRALILTALINLSAIVAIKVFTNDFVLIIAAFLYGSLYSLTSVLGPLLARDNFGEENYRLTLPAVSFAGNLTNAFAISLVGYSYDFTGSYDLALIIALAFNLTAILCAWGSHKMTKASR